MKHKVHFNFLRNKAVEITEKIISCFRLKITNRLEIIDTFPKGFSGNLILVLMMIV